MKIKMVDIARHLGVSKATVSLAVNGKPGVNEETRRMVLECLEEMKKNNGVIPVKENIVTVSGHPVNQMIKIVIVNHSKGAACNSETDLWSDVLATFDSEARRLGYLYGVTYLNDDIAQTEAVITECNMDFVAGVLRFIDNEEHFILMAKTDGTNLFGLKEEDQNLLERIKKPLVLYDCELPDSRYSSVCADNRQMLKSAVDYLYKEGVSDIYYFCTGKDNYNYRVRKEAFLNTKSNEDTASAKHILDLGDEIPKITETLLEWLRKNPLPQGILFENQQISIGALTALRKYGVNIPQEVKVVGFGMIPDYIYQDIKLVQMRISEIEGVLLTMDLLDKKIRQYSMSKVKIYTETEMIIS